MRGWFVLFAVLSFSCATAGTANRDGNEPGAATRDLGPCPVLRVNEERRGNPKDGVEIPCVVHLELDQERWPARYSAAAGWKLFGIEIRPDIAGLCRFVLHDCRDDRGAVVAIAKSTAGPEATRFVFAIRGANDPVGSGRFHLIRIDGGNGILLKSIPLEGTAAPPSKLNEQLDYYEGFWFVPWGRSSGGTRSAFFSGVAPNGEKVPLLMHDLVLWSWNGRGSSTFVHSKCPISHPNFLMLAHLSGMSASEVWLSTTPLEKWRGAVLALNMSFEPIESQARP